MSLIKDCQSFVDSRAVFKANNLIVSYKLAGNDTKDISEDEQIQQNQIEF